MESTARSIDFGPELGRVSVPFVIPCDARIETDRISPPEQRMDNFSRGRVNLAGLPEPTQMVSLDFEQAGFHCRGAP